jgi:hypothetical protein
VEQSLCLATLSKLHTLMHSNSVQAAYGMVAWHAIHAHTASPADPSLSVCICLPVPCTLLLKVLCLWGMLAEPRAAPAAPCSNNRSCCPVSTIGHRYGPSKQLDRLLRRLCSASVKASPMLSFPSSGCIGFQHAQRMSFIDGNKLIFSTYILCRAGKGLAARPAIKYKVSMYVSRSDATLSAFI